MWKISGVGKKRRRSTRAIFSAMPIKGAIDEIPGDSITATAQPFRPPSITFPVCKLSEDQDRRVLEALVKIPIMDVGDWTAVLRSLTWLSSPRWLLTKTGSKWTRNFRYPKSWPTKCALELSYEILTAILYNFISRQGLVPYTLGDKQLVGPSTVQL